MSTPASDLPADTGSTIIEIPGQAARSSFRLRKLLDDLAAIDDDISGVDARYVYFIQLAASLTDEEQQRVRGLFARLREQPEE